MLHALHLDRCIATVANPLPAQAGPAALSGLDDDAILGCVVLFLRLINKALADVLVGLPRAATKRCFGAGYLVFRLSGKALAAAVVGIAGAAAMRRYLGALYLFLSLRKEALAGVVVGPARGATFVLYLVAAEVA